MKNTLGRVTGLVALIVAGALPVHAASDGFIDCNKAEKVDEKAICADIKLIQQDARMVTLFDVATGLVGMGARGDLKDAQIGWLETRHACKDDSACLRTAYAARIERLQKIVDGVTARGPF